MVEEQSLAPVIESELENFLKVRNLAKENQHSNELP